MRDRPYRQTEEGKGHNPKKSLGQNFLIDPNIARWMVDYAQIGEQDVILEIGPGKGMLTREILNSPCSFLHIIEIDRTLAPFIEPLLKRHEARTSLIWGDVLTVNLRDLSPSPTKVLANIPYNITTPLIWQILEHLAPVGTKELVLMLQLDLAERLCAKPGTRDRSPLGITIERMGQAQIVKKVPPSVFWPAPRVESVIVQILLDNNYDLASKRSWRRLLKVAFARRRKTLTNNLACVYDFFKDKDQALKLLEELGLSPTVRAEELNADDWQRLYERILSL
ncbi:dimethyladenosine transferase [Acetomicrobium mobile DSM 13181]|uniref:Ribosomal RNA small subunit methyltransferase A n=1 Tax=Acetomicrobium mobile (strain ATCC BAA-54 / DSM 13181 / JCM 12221 / NGA) TaxID=891968 RepID=I4BW92_ACEMN|nr:16S rRNA (adenine(1518)-N(6)/adenine(1519)-N(6))-dimethyltransferase RsmA [Acetomicrobium mobile]AFM21549.1 dimethyladenosine transferase [Acetomicrobium mobile DSM 13181]